VIYYPNHLGASTLRRSNAPLNLFLIDLLEGRIHGVMWQWWRHCWWHVIKSEWHVSLKIMWMMWLRYPKRVPRVNTNKDLTGGLWLISRSILKYFRGNMSPRLRSFATSGFFRALNTLSLNSRIVKSWSELRTSLLLNPYTIVELWNHKSHRSKWLLIL